MNFLHTEIGSAKDNQKSPIHNWYKFTAGFSYKFVDEIIELEKLSNNKHSEIFDPFAGCGTTLVSAQKKSIKAIGNESQEFMYNVIKGKLGWDIQPDLFKAYLEFIFDSISEENTASSIKTTAHSLLMTLYDEDVLRTLYQIKDSINDIEDKKYSLFLN